jgi:hypothetical protein
MPHRPLRLTCFIPVMGLLVACGRPDAASIREIPLVEVARWGAFDDSVATGGGQVASFVVDPAGEVLATDWRGHRILRYDGAGRYLGSIGREGSGPLEFRQPSEIAVVADTLYVRDNGNNRIAVVGPGRDLVRTITLNPPRVPASFSVGSKGMMLGATRGYPPGKLILVWGPDGNQTSTFGELEHEATMLFDGQLVRDRALAGEVAPFLLNWATTCTTSDESVVLVFYAQPRAQKYSLTGTLRWDVPLSLPEYETVRERWIASNRTSARAPAQRSRAPYRLPPRSRWPADRAPYEPGYSNPSYLLGRWCTLCVEPDYRTLPALSSGQVTAWQQIPSNGRSPWPRCRRSGRRSPPGAPGGGRRHRGSSGNRPPPTAPGRRPVPARADRSPLRARGPGQRWP